MDDEREEERRMEEEIDEKVEERKKEKEEREERKERKEGTSSSFSFRGHWDTGNTVLSPSLFFLSPSFSSLSLGSILSQQQQKFQLYYQQQPPLTSHLLVSPLSILSSSLLRFPVTLFSLFFFLFIPFFACLIS